MPKVVQPSEEQRRWQEAHRCVICDGLPVTINTELLEEHRVLRPEYRHLARYNLPAEPWQTETIGGEYLTTVECENGHQLRAHYHRFREED